MARNFAADSDILYKIDTDHWTTPSGPITMGIWIKCATFKAATMFQLNKWGVGCSYAIGGLDNGGGDTRLYFQVGYSTVPKQIMTNNTSFIGDNTWYLWIIATDGSTNHSNWRVYKGHIGGSMADIMTASGGEVSGQTGTGTQITGATRAIIGNDWDGTHGSRAAFAEAFAVTGQMTVTEMNNLLGGDWGAITRTGSLFFWAPLVGSDANEYVAPLLLDTTGTSAVADPRTTTIEKISDRGVRHSTSGGDATLTVTNPTAIAAGNYLIARVAVDNSGSSGARPGLTVSDARNGTWTHGTGGLQDPGAASAGVATYLCYVKVTTPYQAGDTILFDFTTGSPLSAIVVEEWTNIDTVTPLAVAENQANNLSSTAQPAIARTTLGIGQRVYVCAGLEGFSSYWGAQDSDGTNGAWEDLTKDEANTGTAATSISVYGGSKRVTATGAQTWNNTIGTASDWSACAVVFAVKPVAVTGTSTVVASVAGTGTITATTAITGTGETVASVCDTGVIGPVSTNITGTPAIVASFAGTGAVTGHAAVTGTGTTVASVAGTGSIGVTTAITGTSITVASVAGAGVVTGHAAVTGTSTTVASFAGTGVVTGHTAVTGTSTTVASVAGTGTITATTAITGTGTTVVAFADTGTISGFTDITGTSAIVAVFAGTGTIGIPVTITGTSTTVASFAGTGNIGGQASVTGTTVTVASVCGTGAVTGRASVTGTSITVASVAGTGTITATTAVTGTGATVASVAGTGVVTGHAAVTGTSVTVASVCGSGVVTGHTAVTGTTTTVAVFAGTGIISQQITGTGAVVTVIAGTGVITGHTAITGISAIVVSVTDVGVIVVGSAVVGSGVTIYVFAGTGTITATTAIIGTSESVVSFAGTGTINGHAAVTGTGVTVASIDGTGIVTGYASVTGTSETVGVFAGTGTINGYAAVTGTRAIVSSFAGTGSISGDTAIVGISATVFTITNVGQITIPFILPVRQGAVLVI